MPIAPQPPGPTVTQSNTLVMDAVTEDGYERGKR
jgi:hypothetical protein